jgi:hypothetical protein
LDFEATGVAKVKVKVNDLINRDERDEGDRVKSVSGFKFHIRASA